MWSALTRFFGTQQPQASIDAGAYITTSAALEAVLRGEANSKSGVVVNTETAMRLAVVYRCVGLIAGTVANMPLDIKKRVDDRTRKNVSDHGLWEVLKRRSNRWQKPAQFKRMMEANKLLTGNAYALKVREPTGKKQIRELIPLRPHSVDVIQKDDLSVEYRYTNNKGAQRVFSQDEVFHLMTLTLDGVRGVTPLRYARESIGAALAMESHGANVFRNGAQVSGVLKHPGKLSEEAVGRLRSTLEQYRQQEDKSGQSMILEEGMEWKPTAMNSSDAQWLESRKFSRSDIAMFFGVPPHMLGDTEKSTSWGSGIEQQTQGFVTFTIEDNLTTWEEAITADLINEKDVYARFNRASLVRGDLKARTEAHVRSLQWGWKSPNEVRADEDLNPRQGGDRYYEPPNTAGVGEKEERGNEFEADPEI